ncbi:MAG: hypothetical protein JWL62_3856 [Hyphomicrobiales bacterium]|nr:hypothetical protein [Hyphomicrobiales bacterium]
MKKSLSIVGITAAALMLAMSFAVAQAPEAGRGDQSGGGAAQLSGKRVGAPEVRRRPTKQRMMRHKRMTRHERMMMNRNG